MAGDAGRSNADHEEDGLPERTASAPALLVDGSDRMFRELVQRMLAFSARLQEVRNRFGRSIGLSGPQYSILISIAHLQGRQGVGVNAVARHLHLSGAFVTIEVNRLVSRGLLGKAVNPEDRRRVLLTLTPAGRQRLAQLKPRQVAANDLIFGSLDHADFLALHRITGQLVDGVDAALLFLDYADAGAGPESGRDHADAPVRAGESR
ncbi:MarR family winged helix-turn-helix transcriptional regulator [Propylenella binzhouense]|uniref:MarR family transcriptional regulator n=1 Tax=Propylenella binzhouense TaxID=2555902 RepID=A0A964WUK1_9HYPH|nr:MarR family winged helix-turn-helix transcriptional regulator [Propylenella binzhouense]MYZ49114.1 MarR family transcriptional regulator [Propylenella binzhouense]